ncbi:unnamed protein product [Anisakis simplex]|uniref:HTH La-type RNA-binding domain-containing protein n=1 Tax=Anisakis simplex TaxID=6269 RepID=A0A0M3K0G8_ANISI|nr:unnamed protein product [Anisakis simplex]
MASNKPMISFARIVSGAADPSDSNSNIHSSSTSTGGCVSVNVHTANQNNNINNNDNGNSNSVSGISKQSNQQQQISSSNEDASLNNNNINNNRNNLSSNGPVGGAMGNCNGNNASDRKDAKQLSQHSDSKHQSTSLAQPHPHYYNRRNKPPRYRSEKHPKVKDSGVPAAEKDDSEAVNTQPVQKEIVLEPAPLPAVNAWFSRQSSKRTAEEGVESAKVAQQTPSVNSTQKQSVPALPTAQQQKKVEVNVTTKPTATAPSKDDIKTKPKAGIAISVSATSAAITSEQAAVPSNVPMPTVASVVTGLPVPVQKQNDNEGVRQVDEKVWPSLNAAVLSDEQKADDVTPAGAVATTKAQNTSVRQTQSLDSESDSVEKKHEINTNEAKLDKEKDKEKEKGKEKEKTDGSTATPSNASSKGGKGAKTWKKVDIDVDYAGREGQSRRSNAALSSNRNDHGQSLPRNRRGGLKQQQQSVKDASSAQYVNSTNSENLIKGGVPNGMPGLLPQSGAGVSQAQGQQPRSLMGCAPVSPNDLRANAHNMTTSLTTVGNNHLLQQATSNDTTTQQHHNEYVEENYW